MNAISDNTITPLRRTQSYIEVNQTRKEKKIVKMAAVNGTFCKTFTPV